MNPKKAKEASIGAPAASLHPVGATGEDVPKVEVTKVEFPKPEDTPKLDDSSQKARLTEEILKMLKWNFFLSWAVIAFQIFQKARNMPALDNTSFGIILAASSLTSLSQIVFKYYFDTSSHKRDKTN